MSDAVVKVGPWEWTVWPTVPVPDESWLRAQGAQRGPSWLHEFHAKREQGIADEKLDPLTFGWEPPVWQLVRALIAGTYKPGMIGVSTAPDGWTMVQAANDIAGLGGNGSGKTELQGKLVMEVLTTKPGSEARCFSANESTSVRYIQRALMRYMPPALRKIKSQGVTTKISYKEATGFSENIFVLPNHSACLLPTYKAYQQDTKSVEGGEADIVSWDEEAPGPLLETLRFRVHKKGGIILGGFTPVDGYTESVGQYIEGATILEVVPARLVVWDWWTRSWSWGEWLLPQHQELVKGCPDGHIPLVVQSGSGGKRRFAVCLPTMFNPYTNVTTLVESLAGKPKDYALERLWGWPTKLARKAFPEFCQHHIVPRSKLPPLADLTLYFWTDPHGDRNWFMLWAGVDINGVKWVIREWPDQAGMGEWALPGPKPDGKPGPAQTMGHGKAFNDYKRLIYEIEGWSVQPEGEWQPKRDDKAAWDLRDRRLDPRPAGTSVPSDEASKTYEDYLRDPILLPNGQRAAPGLDIMAGPHCDVEDGKQLINNWIKGGWNPKAPVTPLNCPKFYVCDECENLIWSLKTWTGADMLKGASKDPIDCLKGLAKMNIEWLPAGTLGSYGGGHGY